MYTEDPLTANSVWTTIWGSEKEFLITNLEPGKRYWIKVATLGKNGEIAYTEPVLTRLVQ